MIENDINIEDVDVTTEERRKDPTREEMREYFKLVKESVKQIDIKNGAKVFTFDDGFTCFARNQKNADKKHERSFR